MSLTAEQQEQHLRQVHLSTIPQVLSALSFPPHIVCPDSSSFVLPFAPSPCPSVLLPLLEHACPATLTPYLAWDVVVPATHGCALLYSGQQVRILNLYNECACVVDFDGNFEEVHARWIRQKQLSFWLPPRPPSYGAAVREWGRSGLCL